MPLSSITNSNVAANQANKKNSAALGEQSEKTQAALISDTKSNKFSDNVTLTESGSTAHAEKTAGQDTLEPHAADGLLKQIMKAIITESKTAVAAQANLTPKLAQTLLADE